MSGCLNLLYNIRNNIMTKSVKPLIDNFNCLEKNQKIEKITLLAIGTIVFISGLFGMWEAKHRKSKSLLIEGFSTSFLGLALTFTEVVTLHGNKCEV